jgi:hypothetical protein
MSFDNSNKQRVLEAHGAPINQRAFMTGEKMERGRITAADIKGLLFAPIAPALAEGRESSTQG